MRCNRALGAVAGEPSLVGDVDFDEVAATVPSSIRAMAGVRVVRRWSPSPERRTPYLCQHSREDQKPVELIAIAASTGRPRRAASDLLRAARRPAGSDFCGVQHIRALAFGRRTVAGLARPALRSCASKSRTPGTNVCSPAWSTSRPRTRSRTCAIRHTRRHLRPPRRRRLSALGDVPISIGRTTLGQVTRSL